MSIVKTLQLLFSPAARRELDRKAREADEALSKALKEHSREVALFRRALREGPKLKLIVEPPRRRDGRFACHKPN